MRVWDLWTKWAPTTYSFLFAVLFCLYLWGEVPTAREWVGIAVTFTGFALWILARRQLGQSFAVNPVATKLITHGLYAKFRHPIYYFELFAFTGIAFFFWNIYVTAAILLLLCVQLYRMRRENKLLREKFGSEYAAHVSSVWL